jgi:hypothetical protein
MSWDFSAIVMVADEGGPQLELCLTHLRKAYPFANVRVISDGVDYPEYPEICGRFAVDYELGEYLKRIERGGDWWHRLLSVGLSYGTEWIVKLDPDTIVWRPLKTLPRFPVSGTLHGRKQPTENIQGGFQAIHRNIARRILNSGALQKEDLKRIRVFCPNYEFLRTWIPTGYFTTDHSLMHIMRRMGITWGDWSEVKCAWEAPPPNPDLVFAVTHPHKVKNPRQGVPSNTPIHLITTCKGRLDHLKQVLPTWLTDSYITVTVVDYDCPQQAGKWIKANYPHCRVVSVSDKPKFHLAQARNLGAQQTPPGWWMFIDADMTLKSGWGSAVRAKLQPGHYHIANPLQWSMTGTCVLESKYFQAIGGYDETFRGWAAEDIDFYAMLRQIGCRPHFYPGQYATPIVHNDEIRTQFYDHHKKVTQRLFDDYFHRKSRWMGTHGKIPNHDQKQALLLDAINHNKNTPPEENNYPDQTLSSLLDSPLDQVPITTTDPNELKTLTNPDPELKNPSESFSPLGFPTEPSFSPSSPSSQPLAPPSNGTQSPILTYSPQYSSSSTKMKNISVINHSTLDLGIPFPSLVNLLNLYLEELNTLWPGTLFRCIETQSILPKTRALIILDDPQQNSILGYRPLTPDALPCTKVFVLPYLTQGKSITIPSTHQLAEMQCDPFLNIFNHSLDGTLYPQEVCDPVLDQTFTLNNLPVSNFVTRAWFDPPSNQTQYDYLNLLKQPLSFATTGYTQTWHKDKGWDYRFGSLSVRDRVTNRDPTLRRNTLRRELKSAPDQLMHQQYLNRPSL